MPPKRCTASALVSRAPPTRASGPTTRLPGAPSRGKLAIDCWEHVAATPSGRSPAASGAATAAPVHAPTATMSKAEDLIARTLRGARRLARHPGGQHDVPQPASHHHDVVADVALRGAHLSV